MTRNEAGGKTANRYGTELECCVLGIIRQRQPCTAYQVRRELQISQSSFWSGSAGSVYPLLSRLAARGWVAASEEAWGDGAKQLYRLTRAGERELKQWTTTLPAWAGAVTVDPIRTRVFFFDLLTPAQRIAFLDEARTKTQASLALARKAVEDLRKADDEFGALGYEGCVAELESRLEWLVSLRTALSRRRRT